ncbi:phytoene/squalene synthase family protein [Pararhizobium mangrovi]|uniref:Phytoene/squalene synthase family protein n=1 Tax=Pararhizobium mangrovi TaxID=2590452 RepID=A0A506UHZ9_9HYPH|nr:phytoene/squalene synthase family protein [Pararhizobium mangrovi]TPW32923.1 phytoene/squalene synthase family protein [Pararhizobium mangrovi]
MVSSFAEDSVGPALPAGARRVEAAAALSISAGSKSFAAAACLFDRHTRTDVRLLYAWCRYCDDQIDGQALGHGMHALPSANEARAKLKRLRHLTHEAFADRPTGNDAFEALRLLARRRNLSEALATEHLAGFTMDVEGQRFETFDDTLTYCYRVAGIVGILMARIMGAEHENTLDRACDLGIAFQLTNIARDLVDDAHRGRVYVPERWIAEAGLRPGTLAEPENRAALAALATRLLEAAEPFYASARIGLGDLPMRSAWAVATALGAYRAIGLAVNARGARAWDTRTTTGAFRKVALAARSAGTAFGSRIATRPERDPQLWKRPRPNDKSVSYDEPSTSFGTASPSFTVSSAS